MAFDIRNLSEVRPLGGNRWHWNYYTPDTLSAVLAADYLSTVNGLSRMHVGDVLDIVAASGAESQQVTVGSVAGGSVVLIQSSAGAATDATARAAAAAAQGTASAAAPLTSLTTTAATLAAAAAAAQATADAALPNTGAALATTLADPTAAAAVGATSQKWRGSLTGEVARQLLDHLNDLAVSAKTFGAAMDAVVVTGATSIASAAATLTVVGASFAVADVGKAIVVPGAGAAGAPLVTTISARTDATHVTLTGTASTTLSAVSTSVLYGTDDTVALQAWLDHCRANRAPGYLPPGRALTTTVLWATRTDFQSINIRGAGSAYDVTHGSATRAESIIDHSAVLTLPGLAIQSGRSVYMSDFAMVGPNVLSTAIIAEPTNVAADWIATGVRDNRYSPQCGICIDPITGSSPGGGNGYPGLTYTSLGGTSGVTLERIQFRNQNVALMHAPASGGTQGDNISINDCAVIGAHIFFALGQGQSDAVVVKGGNFGRLRRAFDTVTYGQQSGAPPAVFGGQFGPAYALFAYSAGVKNAYFSRCFLESVKMLGHWGIGSANGTLTLTLHAVDFRTRSDWALPPMMLENYGIIKIDGLAVKDNITNLYAINFVGTGLYEVTGFVAPVQNALRLAMLAPFDLGTPIIVRSGRIYDGTNITFIYDNAPRELTLPARISATANLRSRLTGATKYTYTPGQTNNYRNVATASAHAFDTTAKTITISLTSNTVLQVADLVYWRMLAVSPSIVTTVDIAVRVTSITGAGPYTVVMTMLYDPALYDQTYLPSSLPVHRHEWAPGATCTLTKTSGSTTATVSPTTILQNGDWLSGTGLAADSRVVSGGGTGTITLNLNATASTADACYFGRLFTNTETLAF